MKLQMRPAGPHDVAALVELYDRHYRGGYSACFDRYGPARPQDFWWVQTEKAVLVVELTRRPVGLIVFGRSGRRLLAEEVLVDEAAAEGEAALRQVHDFLTRRFQQERQDVLTLRCAETNTFALAVARRYAFAFANALLVVSGGEAAAAAPEGYQIRRAAPADARAVARLHDEVLAAPLRAGDLDALLRQPEARIFVAERERYPVGFLAAQVRDGVGRWVAGVRDPHRRRGIARALAHHAFQFFHARGAVPVGMYWATDAPAARFARALGARTERAYLYLERPL